MYMVILPVVALELVGSREAGNGCPGLLLVHVEQTCIHTCMVSGAFDLAVGPHV